MSAAVPAGAPGWAEGNIVRVLRSALHNFPECGFAVATFDPHAERTTKVLFSDGVNDDVKVVFERARWRPEWLRATRGRAVEIAGGLRGLSPEEGPEAAPEGTHHLQIFALAGPMNVMIAMWRSTEYGPFGELEVGPLRETAQSVASIVRLGAEIAAAQTAELAANLDRLRLGFVIVDQILRLSFANATAREMLESGAHILSVDNALKVADQVSEARLRQLIAHIASLPKHSPDATGIIAIRSGNGEALARCIANIQRDTEDSLLGTPLFGLTLSTQSQAGVTQPAQLRRLGFTPAEAELAADLLKGLTVTQHAKERGIAVATARAHLKRAMMRVGVHRQADLIRHVVGLC
jgi:DNA-binding CsgD family transcriptional regulator